MKVNSVCKAKSTPRLLVPAVAIASAFLLLGAPASAQTKAEDRLNAMFAEAGRSEAMLRLLMRKLPKGADLHNHGSGGVYVEDMLAWAAEKDGCLLVDEMVLAPGPCEGPTSVPVRGLETRDTDLYNDAIDIMSMGRHDPSFGDPTVSGHERFFASFGRFGFGASNERGKVLAVALEHAAQDNNIYLELMLGPATGVDLSPILRAEPWNEADMAGRFERLRPHLEEAVAFGIKDTDDFIAEARAIHGCDTPTPAPACDVTVRFLLTVLRESPPEEAFGRMALYFMTADADPRYVGINIAQPEDGPISLRDYSLHMRMFAFFKQLYPHIPLSLHAGELTLGLTPPRDLRFHIREAVEIAGAKRIGHGVDIAYEDGAVELLQRMARDKIAVEINLTSNDVILGVKGKEHPLAIYLAAGVPVALSTDDMGVSRGDLTTEYMRAVLEHGLKYTDLRQISRDSLTYSFLEGESLWDESGKVLRDVCKGLPNDRPSAECKALLERSPKARDQWRLEQAFAKFEAEMPEILKVIPPERFPETLK